MRWLLPILLVACGPKTLTPTPDGPVEPADGPPEDSPPAAACDYNELRDTTNDDVPPASGTPEDTGVMFDQKLVVCGSFAADHFDDDITVDVDGYKFTLATTTDLLVRLHGAGAEAIEFVGMDVYGGAAFDELAGTLTFYGDHGVAQMRLQPGTYELAAFALAAAAIEAPVDYRITITADAPATRCPSVVSGASYAEATDGANSTGNDMVTIPSGSPPALTAATDDPEPTGLTVTGSSQDRLGGLLKDVASADQYEDKDTYLIAVGDANELAIKLDWNGTANLDYLLFEANTPSPVVRAIAASNTGPEYQTFSVKPATAYWVLAGAKVGSTLPVAYSASLCGASFALDR